MIPIIYLQGDATSPQAHGPKLIAHVCNDLGGWGAGFVLAISKRWPDPERAYRRWHRERAHNDFGLGATQFVELPSNIWVANMIGQRGTKTGSNGVPVRYEAIEKCLETVGARALELGASVHMPRIGCGLSGGKWTKVEPLLLVQLCERDVATYVYDFD